MAKANKYISKGEAKNNPANDAIKNTQRKSPKIRKPAFFESQKFQRITGSILLLFAIFYALAYTSYFFTWKNDQSAVLNTGFWSYIFNNDIAEVSNWLGKMGAWVSHFFIYRWFGVSSIILSFVAFVISVRILFKLTLVSFNKIVLFVLILMPFVSLFLGVFSSHIGNLEGGFGHQNSLWLKSMFGSFGAFLLVLTIGFIILVAFFNPDFVRLKEWFLQGKKATSEFLESNDLKVTNELPDERKIAEKKPILVNFDEAEDFSDDELEQMVVKSASNVGVSDDASEDKDSFEVIVAKEVSESNDSKDSFGGSDGFAVEIAAEDNILKDDEIDDKTADFGAYDPKLDLSSYVLPSIELLNDYGNKGIQINKEELELNKNRIVDTLKNYGIEIDKIKATVGPTVTLYEIIPAPGVRISKIKNLEDDIALSLAALGIRIIAPIPGKGTIGIEVPNSKPEMVAMRTLIASEKFQNADMDLPVVMGKTITNETFVFDLTKLPHLLVAGATGQGKSVGLNAIMVSILYKKHPAQVKFVLVDPKKVELTLYNKIERHFLAKLPDEAEAIITDTSKVVATLNSLCIEMDDRYEMLKEAQVRTIKEYNTKFIARRLNPEKGHRYLPYIIVLIDEFADLIMTAGKEVEHPIARLAQLARAIGIHLIVATQRPSVNVITGMIKANFPARIAFRVLSKIDSRTILDGSGADQLIGRGDMLVSLGNDMVRLQCGFVDTPEVEAICDFIGEQRAYPSAYLLPEYVSEGSDAPDVSDDELDSMFIDAAKVVVIHQQGSASLLQRKLKLGFNRAGRIIDQMEYHGIIGGSKGSKARDVLINDEMQLEEYLKAKGLL
jgi:S-DNA-T family DNA segregation ATPase FtsK/SpoIIIE